METRRLRAFIKVVEIGSLTRAAEALGIAQPSLSQQVVDLETRFKVKLLTRTRQGVTPTAAGEMLYRHAHIILRQLDQATVELRQTNNEIGGAVTIGLPGSIAPVLALPILRMVRELYPAVTLRVVEGSYALLSELTINARLDLALSNGELTGVNSELLLTDELVLLSPQSLSDTLPPGGHVMVQDLVGHPLILPTRLGSGPSMVVETFARCGVAPTIVAELESAHDLLLAAREGIGSVVMGWVAGVGLAEDLILRRFTNPPMVRPIYISEPAALPPTSTLRAVRQVIVDVVRKMVATDQWPGAVLPEA